MLNLEDFGYTDGDVDTNQSSNGGIHDLIESRYSRRAALFGGLAAAALPGFVLSGCGEGSLTPSGVNVSASNVQTSAGRITALAGNAGRRSGADITASFCNNCDHEGRRRRCRRLIRWGAAIAPAAPAASSA